MANYLRSPKEFGELGLRRNFVLFLKKAWIFSCGPFELF